MPPPRPRGNGCSTGIVPTRPNPSTPMSERQQMALLIQMTAASTDHGRTYQKSKKGDDQMEDMHSSDKIDVKSDKMDEFACEKNEGSNNYDMVAGRGSSLDHNSSMISLNTSKRHFPDINEDECEENDEVKRKRRKEPDTTKEKLNFTTMRVSGVGVTSGSAGCNTANATNNNAGPGSSNSGNCGTAGSIINNNGTTINKNMEKNTKTSNNKTITTNSNRNSNNSSSSSSSSSNNNTNNSALNNEKEQNDTKTKSFDGGEISFDDEEMRSDGSIYNGGLKVPPLKIVIPQQTCSIDTDGTISRTGKINASRNAALPYVVSSNNECSAEGGITAQIVTSATTATVLSGSSTAAVSTSLSSSSSVTLSSLTSATSSTAAISNATASITFTNPRDSPNKTQQTTTTSVICGGILSNGSSNVNGGNLGEDKQQHNNKLSSNEEKNLRVLRSSHRAIAGVSGTTGGSGSSSSTSQERNSNNTSPQMQNSNSPSPSSLTTTSNIANEFIENNSNNNKLIFTQISSGGGVTSSLSPSPLHQNSAITANSLDHENIVNLPSPSTSALTSSASKETAANVIANGNVELHPRKRKIRSKNDETKANLGNNSSSNNNNSNTNGSSNNNSGNNSCNNHNNMNNSNTNGNNSNNNNHYNSNNTSNNSNSNSSNSSSSTSSSNNSSNNNSSNNSNFNNTPELSLYSDSHPHDLPFTNCFQMYINIRRQIEKKWRNVCTVKPRPPQGYNQYLLNTKNYLLYTTLNHHQLGKMETAETLSNQIHDSQIIPNHIKIPPTITSPQMRDIYAIQERERYKLLKRHTVEKEKLCLNVEQEILRVHSRAARNLSCQTLPFSVCTFIKDEEVYNIILPEHDEKEKNNARYRFNGRLLLSWLQDVDDKWEKIKESMILRHHNEAESLHAVQLMDWEIALKKIEFCNYGSQVAIESDHVPIVHVDDFDLLPA